MAATYPHAGWINIRMIHGVRFIGGQICANDP